MRGPVSRTASRRDGSLSSRTKAISWLSGENDGRHAPPPRDLPRAAVGEIDQWNLKAHDRLRGVGEITSVRRRGRHDRAVDAARHAFDALIGEPDAIDLATAVALPGEEQALAVGGPDRPLLGRRMIGQPDDVRPVGVHHEDVDVAFLAARRAERDAPPVGRPARLLVDQSPVLPTRRTAEVARSSTNRRVGPSRSDWNSNSPRSPPGNGLTGWGRSSAGLRPRTLAPGSLTPLAAWRAPPHLPGLG